MYNDSPIKYKNYDKLNRSKFADSIATSIINLPQKSDSIVIGLIGGWGTGKSSLLNLVENNLKGYVKILRFNPWNYYSQQMLFSSFFDELIGCLNLNYKISALLQKYKYKLIGTGIELGNAIQPGIGLLNNFVPDSEFKTLDAIKNKLYEIFKNQPKTVVIIDDIDRLNPNEVKQIFQLVKSLADFPNLIYILAFDKNYVNYALKDWNVDDGKYFHSKEFIDKIIQVPLTIPKFGDEDFFNIFKNKFNKILNNHHSDIKNFNINKLYLFLFPFFKNIRDINRFCNALDFYLYSIDAEIWIHDFALVTALQLFEKDVYDSIKNNSELLTGDMETIEEQFDLIDSLGGNLKNYLNSLFDIDLKHKNAVEHILSNLFPKVNYIINSSHTPNSEISIKLEHCGIMQKEYFDLYFTFDNTNSLSKSRIDSVIWASNENAEDLKTNLLLINKMDLLNSLIDQLYYHITGFNDDGIENLINVFIGNYKELFPDEPFNSYSSKISRAINLIYHLVKKQEFNDEKLFRVINGSENNFFKVCLISDLDGTDLINEDLMLKLKDDISGYLSDYFEKTEFSEIEHIKVNMVFWKNFSGFKFTNNYITNLNDDDLISFVSEYVDYDVFKEKNKLDYESLSHVVELNYINQRFSDIRKKEGYEKCIVVDLFLEEYPEN